MPISITVFKQIPTETIYFWPCGSNNGFISLRSMEQTDIRSFDKTEVSRTTLIRPEKYLDLLSLTHPKMIARGAGLSYCNASVSKNGFSVDMSSFNRILDVNLERKNITVEAGMTIGDLNNFVIARGWIMPVLPGYPSITVGGCIAFNVHGKSQHNIGNFKAWVEEFTLFHPLHGEMTCSPHQNHALFELTVGGMGLTGIIISVTLKIKELPGPGLEIKAVKATGFTEAVKIMHENANSFDYIYSWNDLNLKGASFGKGIVYLERYTKSVSGLNVLRYANRLKAKEKFYNLHSKASIRMMCLGYYCVESIKPSIKQIGIANASFPIYGKEIYYHFLGRRGFREYQVLFASSKWESAVEEIKKLIEDVKIAITLGSLKIFKGDAHHISFAGEGICITIDIPNGEKGLSFFQGLDKIALKYSGTINLSKDSRASTQFVSALFPGYQRFKQQVNEFDLNHTFASELSQRIGISA